MPALDWAALRGRRGVDLTVWPPRYDPAYRPPREATHWLPEVECADPAARDALVLAKLTQQVRYAWERSAFYRRKWQEAGVSPASLRSPDDLARFPVVQKAELRAAQAAAPPFGDYLCIEPAAVEGTPVYTHLERTSQPMIRLVSGDRARWVDTPCPCGRTYPRLPDGLYGRFDDMIIVRGENIYPSAIEDTLRAIEGFGGEFRVIVSRREVMDELLVRAEYAAGHADHPRLDALRATMRERPRARLGVPRRPRPLPPAAASCMSPGPNRESPTPRAKQFG